MAARHPWTARPIHGRQSSPNNIISADSHRLGIYISGGSRICQGGGAGGRTMANARSASLNGGQSPWWEAKPPENESFCTFLYKKWPKVKDLGKNLPPCLSRAAMTSPKLWSWGGGARSAHSWIRHCESRSVKSIYLLRNAWILKFETQFYDGMRNKSTTRERDTAQPNGRASRYVS